MQGKIEKKQGNVNDELLMQLARGASHELRVRWIDLLASLWNNVWGLWIREAMCGIQ
jgi:hypothetical protein